MLWFISGQDFLMGVCVHVCHTSGIQHNVGACSHHCYYRNSHLVVCWNELCPSIMHLQRQVKHFSSMCGGMLQDYVGLIAEQVSFVMALVALGTMTIWVVYLVLV